MRELLEFLARALVDDPDRVEVTEFTDEDGTIVLELDVAPDDRGKVIGRQGRTVKALRSIMKAGGARNEKRIVVEVID